MQQNYNILSPELIVFMVGTTNKALVVLQARRYFVFSLLKFLYFLSLQFLSFFSSQHNIQYNIVKSGNVSSSVMSASLQPYGL